MLNFSRFFFHFSCLFIFFIDIGSFRRPSPDTQTYTYCKNDKINIMNEVPSSHVVLLFVCLLLTLPKKVFDGNEKCYSSLLSHRHILRDLCFFFTIAPVWSRETILRSPLFCHVHPYWMLHSLQTAGKKNLFSFLFLFFFFNFSLEKFIFFS